MEEDAAGTLAGAWKPPPETRSRPFRFNAKERVPGALVVYEKFANYVDTISFLELEPPPAARGTPRYVVSSYSAEISCPV
jgi:hypothetical protein